MEVYGWDEVKSVMVVNMNGGWVRMELVGTLVGGMEPSRKLHASAESGGSVADSRRGRTHPRTPR